MKKLNNIILEPLTALNIKEELLGKAVLEVSKFDKQIGLITGFEKDKVYVYFGNSNTSMLLRYSSVMLLKLY